MTIVSYISVPLIAILGITAMVMAVKTGDVPLAEKFAESQGMSVIAGAGLVIGSFVSGGAATPNFCKIFQNGTAVRYRHSSRILYRQQSDVSASAHSAAFMWAETIFLKLWLR